MTVAFIVTVPPKDGLAEAYDAAMADMGLAGKLPPHAQFHAAGPWEGGWRAVDLWDSDEDFHSFVEGRLGPALAKHQLGEPTIERVECAQVIRGSGRPVLVGVSRMDIDADQAAAASAALYPGERLPEAVVLHANGRAAEGWIAVSAWSSRQARDEFVRSAVQPAMPEGANLRVEDLQVHNTLMEA